MKNLKEILQSFYRISGYPLYAFKNKSCVFPEEFDVTANMENPFLTDTALLSELFDNLNLENVAIMRDKLRESFFYGGVKIKDNTYIIVGPFSDTLVSKKDVIEYIKAHGMHDFTNFFISTVSFTNIEELLKLLSLVFLRKSAAPVYLFDREPQGKEDVSEMEMQGYRLSRGEEMIHHSPYSFEKQELEYISKGDEEKLAEMHANLAKYSLGTVAKNSTKQEEYLAVLGVSFAVRAGIEGGVNPYVAYDLNDLYLQKISLATTVKEYNELSNAARKKIMRLVRIERNRNSNSIYIEKTKSYIAHNLIRKLTLKEIAENVGLTPNYLSEVFSKSEKMTLQEYILREKITAASNMLKFCDEKTGEISNYLGFCSQSHFAAQFKKIMGKTPGEYRRTFKNS